MDMDLIIRGGRIVNADGRFTADIGIRGEVIAQIGGEMRGPEIDARGKTVMPGAIDAHVHVTMEAEPDDGIGWADNFTSGSRAALAGGVTTIGNMTFLGESESILGGLEREAALVREDAIADVILHPVLGDPRQEIIDEIPQAVAAGHTDIKYFMSMSAFDRKLRGYLDATAMAGRHGAITMIHCEDHAIIAQCVARLMAEGRGSLRNYPESRPIVSEVVAVQRAVAICEVTEAPVYIVHLSSERAMEVCQEAQARGLPVYVETRPLYLHLTSERFLEPDGAKYVGQPPLREPNDVAALWAAIAGGSLHTICTDHAPWELKHKLDPALNVKNLRPGMENLQTMLPMLHSLGVREGKITLERMVAATATNVARLFGMYPRKGTIAVGSDADLVIWDLEETRTIRDEDVLSLAGHSIYNGWEITGWPQTTIRRGEVVYDQRVVTGKPGSGKLIPRGPTQPI